MILFWLLAVLLPSGMAFGFAMTTRRLRLPGMDAEATEALGFQITEASALLALIAFLVGLNISLA